MAELPLAFTQYTRQLMGDTRFERYLQSFKEDTPVSIRLNPQKTEGLTVVEGEKVPWCRDGYYLPQRPNFTMDPLLHAGCYYVQEAASMFLDEVLRQHVIGCGEQVPQSPTPHMVLDLCAAPGGKSTLLRSVLPADCVLYSNEPVRQRANILAENVQKWGAQNHLVTNCYPRDYRKAKLTFDIIVCDVPCSGEGMFRKDEATIREWSPQQVEKCCQLQRDIVSDAWACLEDGGLLIYSTCTFNTKENEENIRWICTELGAEVLPVSIQPEWHITGSLLADFHEPVYRFIPGISRGEGLFMAVLRKGGERACEKAQKRSNNNGKGKAANKSKAQDTLNVLFESNRDSTPLPRAELSYQQALAYLRHEALVLSDDTPRGMVEVTFLGHPLGPVKNIGTRANNLYPKEWKIKTTHIPDTYEPILKQL